MAFEDVARQDLRIVRADRVDEVLVVRELDRRQAGRLGRGIAGESEPGPFSFFTPTAPMYDCQRRPLSSIHSQPFEP